MVWLLRRGSTEWLEEIGTILEDQQSTKKHATSTIAEPVRTHSETRVFPALTSWTIFGVLSILSKTFY